MLKYRCTVFRGDEPDMSDDMDLTPRLDPPNGRDERGYFTRGNGHARGHSGPRRTTELRKAYQDAITPEKIGEVEQSLYELALGGDVAAIRVWLEFAIGKPRQQVEVSGPDGEPLGVADVVAVIMQAFPDDVKARVKIAAAFRRMGRLESEAAGGLG
jgi:hypothetical protein